MENRRIIAPLNKGHFKDDHPLPESSRPTSDTRPQTLKHIKDPDDLPENKIPGRSRYFKKKEKSMNRTFTMDEITTAQLLKGHPQAQEILDELNKGKKRNESGEEFQDGSEDTIGSDGHAAVARPGSIKHEGGFKGKASDDPGVDAKRASEDDFDLEKAEERGTLTDNEPEEFEEGIEEDDTIPAEKSMTQDELTIDYLVKTMGEDKAEEFLKAVIGGRKLDPGQVSSVMRGSPQAGHLSGGPAPEVKARAAAEREKMKDTALRAMKQKFGTGGAEKSEDDFDLEKAEPNYQETDEAQRKVESGEAERKRKAQAKIKASGIQSETEKSEDDFDIEKGKGGQKEERAEWAKDPEGEKREHEKDKDKDMSEKSWSLDFSKSILENMGLEKGSPSVSQKVGRQKATQISYGTKPESRVSDPAAKEEKRYRHNIKEGTVTVRKKTKGEEGGKWKEGKPIGVGEQEKLKNASEGGFDLHKALDEILEKKTLR